MPLQDHPFVSYTNTAWAKLIARAEGEYTALAAPPALDVSSPVALAAIIDHTHLTPGSPPSAIGQLVNEAVIGEFGAVCIYPERIPLALSLLSSPSPILHRPKIATVISFPAGTKMTAEKVADGQAALAAGAQELDVVLNRRPLQEGEYAAVYAELAAVRAGCSGVLKLILETSRLSAHEIIAATVLATTAGWEFVKTSTGFHGPGARVEDVRVMRRVGQWMVKWMGEEGFSRGVLQVKASGGIKTVGDARAMVEAGATRIGASAGVGILKEAKGDTAKTRVEEGGY
ncbi:deoxyribose-phosphate aldolase [Trichodelitschia bisporula]|uniref:deoxyribose-phosphate aldolase n=1 Tax=Trichodelitschia bisporula TaxID=703511 RepID=A0A6G1HX10_9PEZI|nr:deoxyribose-phosphate aldolase [Trichodelitschia bisporula]